MKKMQEEFQRIELSSSIGDDGVSLGPVQAGSARYNDMRRQLDKLKEELLQSETNREDMRLKSLQQENEIQVLHQRIEDMNVSFGNCNTNNRKKKIETNKTKYKIYKFIWLWTQHIVTSI